jgi:Mrp family chromosome partitioning ATPase
LDVADATVLAPLVDGVVLVVGRNLVRQEAVQTVCEQLTAVHAHPVGVVVNRARPRHAHYYARDS